ncbi:MAG: phosphoribosylanthranilate isomerase [Gemmatimonadota bacterium]
MSALVRVKVCGLMRPQDAAVAAAAGAHYLGTVLTPGYRRSVDDARAADVFAGAEAGRRVGVFVDADADHVLRLAAALELDVVQLHGSETVATAVDLAAHGLEVWKAVTPRAAGDVRGAVERWSEAAQGILLDGFSARAPGGTGARFDWAAAAGEWPPGGAGALLIAAGGLAPANVGQAIRTLRPDVVDVSSGVELAVGRKDPVLVERFIAAAAAASGARAAPASDGGSR